MPIVQHLVADTFGTHIGKYSKRIKITQKGKTLTQAPLLHLETISVLSRGVSISVDVLEACTERGIPIFFVDSRGTPYASIYSAGLAGTVITRREQLRAYDDERGIVLGLSFVYAKIQNQSNLLRYLAKMRKDTPEGEELRLRASEVLDSQAALEKVEGTTIYDMSQQVMSIEAVAGKRYWQAVRLILPQAYGWHSRETRGATDPINSLLNYGYGILYGQIERALVLAGLDPYAGFVHADRPGKPSLVLDVIEEFRQAVVDRVVFGLANRHFVVDQDADHRLSEDTRHTFADHILNHLDASMRYGGKRYPLRHIIQMQCRHIAAFLRGETDTYTPFKMEV